MPCARSRKPTCAAPSTCAACSRGWPRAAWPNAAFHAAVRARLAACLDEGEQVLSKGQLDAEDIDAWSRLNEVFHRTIAGAGESRVVADAIERNNRLPFASSDSITVDRSALAKEYEKLRIAQLQHRLVFEALENGEASRVEGLMREHAYIGVRYLRHL